MNSDQNNPFNLVSENSETDLKRDSRLAVLDMRFTGAVESQHIGRLRRERAVNLEKAGEWSGDPFEQLREAMAPRVVTPDVTGEVQAMLDRDAACRAARAPERLGRVLITTRGHPRRGFLACLALCEALRSPDVILVGDLVTDDLMRMAIPVVETSPHPGERHRQVSRQLTSGRSRAGKAGRWS